MSGVNGKPGVVTVPATQIRDSIKRQVEAVLATLPTDKAQVAEIGVDLATGVNLVYAARFGEEWTAVAYVGKNWSGPIEGGAFLRWTQ